MQKKGNFFFHQIEAYVISDEIPQVVLSGASISFVNNVNGRRGNAGIGKSHILRGYFEPKNFKQIMVVALYII